MFPWFAFGRLVPRTRLSDSAYPRLPAPSIALCPAHPRHWMSNPWLQWRLPRGTAHSPAPLFQWVVFPRADATAWRPHMVSTQPFPFFLDNTRCSSRQQGWKKACLHHPSNGVLVSGNGLPRPPATGCHWLPRSEENARDSVKTRLEGELVWLTQLLPHCPQASTNRKRQEENQEFNRP